MHFSQFSCVLLDEFFTLSRTSWRILQWRTRGANHIVQFLYTILAINDASFVFREFMIPVLSCICVPVN